VDVSFAPSKKWLLVQNENGTNRNKCDKLGWIASALTFLVTACHDTYNLYYVVMYGYISSPVLGISSLFILLMLLALSMHGRGLADIIRS
jgi:hypothetical protein